MDSRNSAFQEALQRAKQLAAKISQPTPTGIKRTHDDDNDSLSDAKKLDVGAKLSALKNPQKPQKDQLYLSGAIFNGEKVLDIMIPGNKVGFVIGKGGEMIRNLQERAGVKMVIFQESSEAGERDKQLRISGIPDKVDHAKQMVNDLLVEKELEQANRSKTNFISPLNDYGSTRITYHEYPVSPQLIGLVIGKGGETIRKIQADSGCKVQFDTSKVDTHGNKICQFTGTPDCVNRALDMVKEIIETVTGGQGTVEEIRLTVPTSRTGTVIGRGGETIRQLKQQSGCNIELDKNFQSDGEEKCFIIRGTADKISYAQQLVTDKVGGHATVILNTMQNNPLYADGQLNYLSQLYGNQFGQSQYYWPQSADQQEQYAAWYYQQYAQYANGAAAAAAGTDQQAWGQEQESAYQQWIEYYKTCGMVKEAKALEQKLKEYQATKKDSTNDNSSGGNGAGTSNSNSTDYHHNGND